MAEAIELLHARAPVVDLGDTRLSPVIIRMEVIRERPKISKLYAPLGDLDNFEKGVWDAITKAGHWWKDDRQVIDSATVKRWAAPGESEGYQISMEFITDARYSG